MLIPPPTNQPHVPQPPPARPQEPGSLGYFETNGHENIQSIFSTTKCYDLIGSSNKIVIFETSITFQQAFTAMAEHEALIAPIWEPSSQIFVSMITPTDYLDTIRLCLHQRVPPNEIICKPIRDMLHTSLGSVSHSVFQTIDAEDTVYEMCKSLQELGNDFAPIIDSEDGTSLVGTLGYMDIVNLMAQAAGQLPHLFTEKIEDLRNRTLGQIVMSGAGAGAGGHTGGSGSVGAGLAGSNTGGIGSGVVGSYVSGSARASFSSRRGNDVIPLSNLTVGKSTSLGDVLNIMYDKDLCCIPVVEDEGAQSAQGAGPAGGVGTDGSSAARSVNANFGGTASGVGIGGTLAGAGAGATSNVGRVIGLYHKEDVSFIANAATPEAQEFIINNALSIPIGDIVKHQLGDASSVHRFCTCTVRDTIKQVLDLMLNRRVTRVVCVDDNLRCVCTISIADIVWYYFD